MRSASYCLGALQVLREEGVYAPAKYLSAVSGGSYIASALITTAAKHAGDAPLDPPSFAPGSPEERHLRTHSSYMAPGARDKARLLLRVLSGMAFNLLLVGLASALVVLPIAWLYGTTYPQLQDPNGSGLLDHWKLLAIPAGVLLLLSGALSVELWENEGNRPSADRWTAPVALSALIALGLLVIVPQAVLTARSISGGGIGWVENLLGRPATGDAKDAGALLAAVNVGALLSAAAGALSAFVSRRRRVLLRVAAFVAGPLMVLVPALLIVNLGATAPAAPGALIGWSLAAVVGVALWFIIDVTQVSLHPFYRRRLGTAFNVRRVREEGEQPRAEPLGEHAPLTWKDLSPDRAPPGPQLIVCAAANVTEEGHTPPGRGAVPFVFTADAIGVPGNLSEPPITPTEYEAGADVARYLSVPAAVAMSGAAISPLMGKKTVRAVRVLMALMNVRLGVWMPNPTRARRHQGKPLRRRPPPRYLLKEMVGQTRLKDPYLYVTDGGHFDNLGFIELLRRGCTTIFCLDGGGDPAGTFRALGDAVALARSELQVDVEIDPSPIAPMRKSRRSKQDFVLGTYRFRALPSGGNPDLLGTEGRIVYCRAAVTQDAPWDVRAFHERDKRFPYHSTMDQLFTDEKFESYRALGAHTARRAVHEWRRDAVRRGILEVLRQNARDRTCVTYAALAAAVGHELATAGLDTLRPFLQEIEREEQDAERPSLVLVVQDAAPAEDVGQQLEAVYRYWQRLPVVPRMD